jgi:hypothetical protein
MSAKSFGTLFARLGERAGMAFPIFPHMLRHACGYALANAGHDTRALQAWLGHRNTGTSGEIEIWCCELRADCFGCGWSCRCYGSAASAVETWWTFPLNDWVPAPSAGGNDPKSWGAIPLEEKDGRGIAKPAFDPDQWLRDAQAQGGVHHIGEGTPLVRECSTLIGLRISGERPDYARMTSS